MDAMVVAMVLQSLAPSPSCHRLYCHVWYWSPSWYLGLDQSGGASSMVPCSPTASLLGSGKCSIEFWTGFLAWYHWLQRNLVLGIRLSPKAAQPLSHSTGSLPLGHLCQAGDGGRCLCHASVGCWAWSISTLSPWLADNGQREMVPLLTDQAVWKKVSDKLLSLFSCLLPVKALAGMQHWTCWSYGPVLPSLQYTERESISGFAELPCILQHKRNLPLWAAAGLCDCSSPSESHPASDPETQGNETMCCFTWQDFTESCCTHN